MTIENFVNNGDKGRQNIEYDDLLTSAGALGRYQWLLFFSTCPFFAFGVFVYYSQILMTEVSPNHWCWIPELANMTDVQRRDLGVPKDANARFGYSQCEMFAVNWTDVLVTGYKSNQTWKIVSCEHGWEFNKSEIPYPTVGSDFEWVCEKSSYQATAQAVFFIGCIFGGLAAGCIADRFGRLPAITVSCLVGSVGGFASTFARNFIEFTAARFVMGMSFDTCMIMAYLLILEYIGLKYRTLLANLSFAISYCLFVTILPWIALLCGHWKTIALVTSLPLTLGMLTKFFLPESPMWLLAKGRVNEVIEKVQVIGQINNKSVPPELVAKFRQSVNNINEKEHKSLFEIFRKPVLRKVFVLICLETMCCALVFDGLIRNIGQLEFNFFISFSLLSFIELPSALTVCFAMDCMGRRWLTIVFMAICCLFCILIIFVDGILTVVFAIIAKYAVNVSYGASTQWGPELLPTSVRGSGISVIHICGFLILFLSPYIIYLKEYFFWLPLAILGTIAGLGVLIAFALPDTTMKGMPHSFEDAEAITKNQRLWTLPFLEARKMNRSHVRETDPSFNLT